MSAPLLNVPSKSSQDSDEEDKNLLLKTSWCHIVLAFEPAHGVKEFVIDDWLEASRFSNDYNELLLTQNLRVQIASALGFVVFLPYIYGRYGMKWSADRKVLASGFGFLVGLMCWLLALASFWAIEASIRCFNWLDVRCFRKNIRSLLYVAHFSYMRQKMPSVQFNSLEQFGISDRLFKTAVDLGYFIFIAEVVIIGYSENELGLSMVVGVAMGELYCKVLDYLLAPPDSVIGLIKFHLRNAAPDHLWLRLFETNSTCFYLTLADANVLSDINVRAGTTRRIQSITVDSQYMPCESSHSLSDGNRLFDGMPLFDLYDGNLRDPGPSDMVY